MIPNFSYILPGQLAGCAQPGRFGAVGDELAELRALGIGAIVSLTERALPAAIVAEAGFRYLHLPVRDFTPPTRGQVREFVDFVDACLAEEVAVVAHCGAGMGRTGTMLAGYLVSRGRSAAEAIAEVRRARPGSVETAEQERCLADFQKAVKIRKRRRK